MGTKGCLMKVCSWMAHCGQSYLFGQRKETSIGPESLGTASGFFQEYKRTTWLALLVLEHTKSLLSWQPQHCNLPLVSVSDLLCCRAMPTSRVFDVAFSRYIKCTGMQHMEPQATRRVLTCTRTGALGAGSGEDTSLSISRPRAIMPRPALAWWPFSGVLGGRAACGSPPSGGLGLFIAGASATSTVSARSGGG